MDKQVNISEFLGLRKSTVGMLFMVILVGLGEWMAERFLPIYLIALGGGSISIGLLNGFDNLLSTLDAFPGGYFSDRMGTKNALLIFNIIAMFGLYYLLRDTVVSVAAFGGAFLWQIGPFTNFIVAFLFGVAGTAFFALYGTDFPNSDLNNRLSKGF
jgi:MFS family permease